MKNQVGRGGLIVGFQIGLTAAAADAVVVVTAWRVRHIKYEISRACHGAAVNDTHLLEESQQKIHGQGGLGGRQVRQWKAVEDGINGRKL